MSIWTPSGEYELSATDSEESSEEPESADSPPELTPEEQSALASEFEEAKQRISETPVDQIITTHIIGLYELAVIHLQKDPPDLESAKIAVNAMSGIVEGVAEDLQEYEEAMRNALTEIQMAFVKASDS